MEKLTKINDNIYRLTIPFMDIYTTVYSVKINDGFLLFDTATYDSDVTDYIIPFLEEIGATSDSLKYVFISHFHGDHAGGLPELLKNYPNVTIITRCPAICEQFKDYKTLMPEDGMELEECLKVVAIPGHSPDSAGILDTRTKTLICGDSLQLYGIYGSGNWGANISLPTEHFAAIEKLRGMDIECIYTAHDYHPCGYCYSGEIEIEAALDACVAPLREIMNMIRTNPKASDEEIMAEYNERKLPFVGTHVAKALRKII